MPSTEKAGPTRSAATAADVTILYISVIWRRRDAAPIPVHYEKIACETVPLREVGMRQIENVSGQPRPVPEWSATATGFIHIPSAKGALNTDIGIGK
jgi:hypothetical protein